MIAAQKRRFLRAVKKSFTFSKFRAKAASIAKRKGNQTQRQPSAKATKRKGNQAQRQPNAKATKRKGNQAQRQPTTKTQPAVFKPPGCVLLLTGGAFSRRCYFVFTRPQPKRQQLKLWRNFFALKLVFNFLHLLQPTQIAV